MSTKLLLPLLTRISQDRATKLDNLDYLDESLSSRASASTALSNATWTNTRAGYLDNLDYLDESLSSRAPTSTALSNATWTNTRAGYLDNLDATISSRSTLTAAQVWSYGTKNVTATSIPSVIQSVQRGTVTLEHNGDKSKIVAISSVNTSKSFILSSFKVSTGYLDDYLTTIKFNSSTELLLKRDDDNATVSVHWQVIEFK